MQIVVKISGDKEVIRKVKKLGRDLYMLKSAMDDIGEKLEDYYSNVAYASQGGVYGEPWQQLSTYYRARKARRYPGRSMLVASGSMQKRYTHKANDSSVYISNTDPKFKYHQSTEPRTKMPRRATIGKNRAVIAIVEQIIKKEINNKIRKAGL